MGEHPPHKLCYRIDEAANALGVCRSQVYKLAKRGELEVGTMAGRTVVLREKLEAFVAANYRPLEGVKGAVK